MTNRRTQTWAAGLLALLTGCATPGGRTYQNKEMDFGSIRTVAILPFQNLSSAQTAGERVRDVFANMLLATGAVYVLPPGEVARGVQRAGLASAVSPSVEEIVKLGGLLKADAVIAGVIKEYGEVRSANSTANSISMSATMFETGTGKAVWSASTTKGGVSMGARLFGGGGSPMNEVTEEAVDALLATLFK